ncbi:hypothetical protein IQ244_10995 [Nostoc sp. LEGE 06077]|uniref:hypothetical protein n=1 Tax=Nostoc sp. LEGE 06077 TaxID=915325 RepID=UPI001880398F|nr:hypothetical protein [Nostoc sp. LEGE 06077]MBE9207037.1 hypothetical protein [Nostoc sp. LEGE 06077]
MSNHKQDERSLVQLPSEDRKETMKTHHEDNQNPLLMLTARGLKFFGWTLVGFAIAFVIFHIFGAFSLAQSLLSVDVWVWFARVAASLFCLFAIAMIFESWR